MADPQSIVSTPAPSSIGLGNSAPPLSSGPLLSRGAIWLVGFTLVMMVALLVLLVVLLKKDGRHVAPVAKDPSPAKQPEQKAARPGEEIADRPDKQDRAPEAVEELVGVLMLNHLHQNSVIIGLVADGVGRRTYTVEEGKSLLRDVGTAVDQVERQLAQWPQEALRQEEKKLLENVRAVLSLQRSEMKELRSYWDTSDEDYERRFQKVQADARVEIDKLLKAQ